MESTKLIVKSCHQKSQILKAQTKKTVLPFHTTILWQLVLQLQNYTVIDNHHASIWITARTGKQRPLLHIFHYFGYITERSL